MRPYVFFVALFCFVLLMTPLSSADAFQESGGLVVIQVESEPTTASWTQETTFAGFTGAAYYEWKKGNTSTSVDSAGTGTLSYPIAISTTGRYRLQVRSSPSASTDYNDCWIRVLGASKVEAVRSNGSDIRNLGNAWTKSYNNASNTWTWDTNTVDHDPHGFYIEASAGSTITVELSGRSTQFRIDRLVLYTSAHSTSAATNTALPESPRSGGGSSGDGDGSVTISGERKLWHRVDLKQAAKSSSETADPNPFLDYRFDAIFTAPSGAIIRVPGYFAGDGAGGDSGNVWMAHLNPAETGTWSYAVSFRAGTAVAVDLGASAGTAVAPFDGKTGTFTVAASDKSGDDFRAIDKGMLVNRNNHYLTYAASGKPFIFTGPGIPENILGYRGFTNTTVGTGHQFNAHLSHWHTGDPDWNSGAGKKLIGALNYIAENGGNSLYLMSNTIGGDGNDCFPHPTTTTSKTRYDLHKLQQWDLALAHAQAKGIYLHWVLAENETPNYTYYGGSASSGSLTTARKLYFRMLNARFGHYNGLKWNLCEETEWNQAERAAQMAYLHAIDPYDHPVTFQTGGIGLPWTEFDTHLGDVNIDALSFQGSLSRTAMFDKMKEYRDKSATNGVKWTVAWDEPQKIENNMDDAVGYPLGRHDKMWPCLMGGGDGFLWYVQADGGGHGFDQQIEDLTIMQSAFRWSGYARDFLNPLPLLHMQPSRAVVTSTTGEDYALVHAGEVYAIYNDRAGSGMSLDLSAIAGTVTFSVRWFDPRNGGGLQSGTVSTVSGGGIRDLGQAPDSITQDWAVQVTRTGGGGDTIAPSIDRAARSDGSVSGGRGALLSVRASDAGGGLTYTWSKLSGPGAASFNPNDTAGADDTTVTVDRAGTYLFRVLVRDGAGNTATSEVTVEFMAVLEALQMSPTTATIAVDTQISFSVTARDQFNHSLAVPSLAWSTTGGGTVTAGIFTAGSASGGPWQVTATGGGKTDSALISITPTSSAPTTVLADGDDRNGCGVGSSAFGILFALALCLKRR